MRQILYICNFFYWLHKENYLKRKISWDKIVIQIIEADLLQLGPSPLSPPSLLLVSGLAGNQQSCSFLLETQERILEEYIALCFKFTIILARELWEMTGAGDGINWRFFLMDWQSISRAHMCLHVTCKFVSLSKWKNNR